MRQMLGLKTYRNTGDTINDLSELEQFILGEMINNLRITGDGLSSKIDRTPKHIQRGLDVLKNKGYIRRTGSNKSDYWEALKRFA